MFNVRLKAFLLCSNVTERKCLNLQGQNDLFIDLVILVCNIVVWKGLQFITLPAEITVNNYS